MGANANANGGKSLALAIPKIDDYQAQVEASGKVHHESTRALGELLRDVNVKNPMTFRLFCSNETNSNRLGAVFEVENRCSAGAVHAADDHVTHSGRVMEVLSEHNCEGWLEGYLLTGRHGLFATYEAFALVVASMTTQHAKWLEMCGALPWRTPIPSLNILLTSTRWRNDHNGFSHQGPGFIDTIVSKKGTVARVYLPPDANCLLSVLSASNITPGNQRASLRISWALVRVHRLRTWQRSSPAHHCRARWKWREYGCDP